MEKYKLLLFFDMYHGIIMKFSTWYYSNTHFYLCTYGNTVFNMN